ncbi:MAG TPA: hypothetical protein VK638_21340 [Edaphobacter sp.]|nr:hypothetical protein [Edaphobacter sp.]
MSFNFQSIDEKGATSSQTALGLGASFQCNRHTLKSLVLGAALLSGPLLAQQQPGMISQGQTSPAIQLPASGRSQSSDEVSSQQTTSQGTGANVLQPSLSIRDNYQGSVPGTPVPSGPLTLSLVDAVKRGLRANLGIVSANVSSASVRAQRVRVLSQLLPQITASLGATETQINLAVYGLNSIGGGGSGGTFSAVPTIVGPFHYVQGQGSFNWNALNIANLRNYQAIKEVDRASGLNQRDSRELVVLAVA